jgi:predicted DNA-binding protein (UPF0251 family)
MSRPKKKKLISAEPAYRCFGCRGRCEAPKIEMSLEEYETIALLDGAGLSQEETAFRMGVSRTTITALYASARAKIADFLIHGKRLSLAGGCYEIAKGDAPQGIDTYQKEGKENMKIAVSYENEQVFLAFWPKPELQTLRNQRQKSQGHPSGSHRWRRPPGSDPLASGAARQCPHLRWDRRHGHRFA